MPPTEVRPQTFNSLQSSDSDSPSVRFQTGQNTLFNLRPTRMYKPLPCQLIPVCQLFCAVAKYANFDGPAFCPRCLGGLSTKIIVQHLDAKLIKNFVSNIVNRRAVDPALLSSHR